MLTPSWLSLPSFVKGVYVTMFAVSVCADRIDAVFRSWVFSPSRDDGFAGLGSLPYWYEAVVILQSIGQIVFAKVSLLVSVTMVLLGFRADRTTTSDKLRLALPSLFAMDEGY